MKSVLASVVPTTPVIDLMHDAPAFNPQAGAILLSALSNYMSQQSITVAVVDPGVGDPERRPLMLKADGRWFVGPDNGLLEVVVQNASELICYELQLDHEISKSFHGRDVFAPAAGQLANNTLPASKIIDISTLVVTKSSLEMYEVIYFDRYGNAMTNILEKAIRQDQVILIDGNEIAYAETFSSVSKGTVFWYVNSIGLVEISINQGSAVLTLGLDIGKTIELI